MDVNFEMHVIGLNKITSSINLSLLLHHDYGLGAKKFGNIRKKTYVLKMDNCTLIKGTNKAD